MAPLPRGKQKGLLKSGEAVFPALLLLTNELRAC